MVLFGAENAPVAVDLYTSLACSDCKSFHQIMFGVLLNEFARPGKISLATREYFQPKSALALEAAKAGTVAARLGKYEQATDALFTSQEDWIATGNVWEVLQTVLGPEDKKASQRLMNDSSVIAEINADLAHGKAAGVRGTPIMYIRNGGKKTPFVGVPEVNMFRRFLESILTAQPV